MISLWKHVDRLHAFDPKWAINQQREVSCQSLRLARNINNPPGREPNQRPERLCVASGARRIEYDGIRSFLQAVQRILGLCLHEFYIVCAFGVLAVG